jgi:uncharacterized phiE125 gp8 family phage protein
MPYAAKFKITTAPSSEPVTLTEAKDQCRVDNESTHDDTFLNNAITTAREYYEQVTDRFLMPRTVQVALKRFPGIRQIELAGAVVRSITSVQYYDSDNTLQTLSSSKYYLFDYFFPNAVVLDSAEAWPDTYERENAVIITYEAGYTNASEVPQKSKTAILMMVAELFANRESSSVTGTVSSLTRAYTNLISSEKTYGRY